MRIFLALMTTLLLVALLAAGFWRLASSHWDIIRIEAENQTLHNKLAVEEQLDSLVHGLSARLPSLAMRRDWPGKKSFEQFASGILAEYDHVKVVTWTPLVKSKQRKKFEDWQQMGHPQFEIWSYAPTGEQPRLSGDNLSDKLFFPVTMVEPQRLKGIVAGLNMNTIAPPMRGSAIDALLSSGAAALLVPNVDLFSTTADKNLSLLMLPVTDAPGLNLATLRGLIVFAIDIERLLKNRIFSGMEDRFVYQLYDRSGQQRSRVIANGEDSNTGFRFQREINTPFDKSWSLIINPKEEYLADKRLALIEMLVLSMAAFVVFGLLCVQIIRWQRVDAVKQVDVHTGKLKQANERLNKSNRELEALSKVDQLTSLANRRGFDETLEAEWKRSMRNRSSLAVLVIDVDHFKLYNDSYGHVQGDQCLQQIAAELRRVFNRSGDFIARYGGEEFAVIAVNTGGEIMKLAEKSRRAIEALQIPHNSSPTSDYVTISTGASSVVPDMRLNNKDLVESADQGLYLAKEHGRNQVNYHICLQTVVENGTGAA